MRDRSYRRHQLERAKARARALLTMRWYPGNRLHPVDARAIGRRAATPCPCSGPCCGNPRRDGWTKSEDRLTLQERRAVQD